MDTTFTKQCNKCKKLKLFEFFNKDKHEKDGYRDDCRECYKKDYIKNSHAYNATVERWKKNNPERVSATRKKFYERHPERRSSASKSRERRRVVKYEVMAHYSSSEQPKCKMCGFSDIRALVIDHMDNNGAEERRMSGRGSKRGGSEFYAYLKRSKYPEGYQTLCYNCNIIKHIEFISK